MLCDEARALLQHGESPAAEAHLQLCSTCFTWLEDHDQLVTVLRAARPEPVASPAAITPRVLAAWNPARVSRPMALAAGAVLMMLAGIVLLAAVIASPSTFASVLAAASGAVLFTGGLVAALLSIPRALLFDNPTVLALYVALTAVACTFWARLLQRTQTQRRVIR